MTRRFLGALAALVLVATWILPSALAAATVGAQVAEAGAQGAHLTAPALADPARAFVAASTPIGNAGTAFAPLAVARPSAVSLGIRYVVVIVMENRAYSSIIGSKNAPYLNSLTRSYGLATNYTGVAHPSEPNYLALFGGSTFGVQDDGVHAISGINLADQLEAHGLTWRVAAENVPSGCFTGATHFGGGDGAGWYARKHEPAISFRTVSSSTTRCARIGNLASFRAGGANVQFVFPNLCHDMHDCSTATGDAFLKSWLPRILTSPTFKQTLVLITWDEGTDATGGGGRVATLLVGPSVPAGLRVTTKTNHYSTLRSIEDLWSLGCLRNACSATNLFSSLRPAPTP